eukprot:TRINITY_DN573_c0_g2_i1.p1 TRINITY_DN573_c0_g2~~TRINITY_DN573_c0_g2_i1.p1  ORF type:complete len:1604 (+),score=329.97 TRINITY_DN573_c0_g2_i1:137-4948(+)
MSVESGKRKSTIKGKQRSLFSGVTTVSLAGDFNVGAPVPEPDATWVVRGGELHQLPVGEAPKAPSVKQVQPIPKPPSLSRSSATDSPRGAMGGKYTPRTSQNLPSIPSMQLAHQQPQQQVIRRGSTDSSTEEISQRTLQRMSFKNAQSQLSPRPPTSPRPPQSPPQPQPSQQQLIKASPSPVSDTGKTGPSLREKATERAFSVMSSRQTPSPSGAAPAVPLLPLAKIPSEREDPQHCEEELWKEEQERLIKPFTRLSIPDERDVFTELPEKRASTATPVRECPTVPMERRSSLSSSRMAAFQFPRRSPRPSLDRTSSERNSRGSIDPVLQGALMIQSNQLVHRSTIPFVPEIPQPPVEGGASPIHSARQSRQGSTGSSTASVAAAAVSAVNRRKSLSEEATPTRTAVTTFELELEQEQEPLEPETPAEPTGEHSEEKQSKEQVEDVKESETVAKQAQKRVEEVTLPSPHAASEPPFSPEPPLSPSNLDAIDSEDKPSYFTPQTEPEEKQPPAQAVVASPETSPEGDVLPPILKLNCEKAQRMKEKGLNEEKPSCLSPTVTGMPRGRTASFSPLPKKASIGEPPMRRPHRGSIVSPVGRRSSIAPGAQRARSKSISEGKQQGVKKDGVTAKAKEHIRRMSQRRGSSEVPVTFLKSKDWRKKANVGFSRHGNHFLAKPVSRRLWHDIDEGSAAKDLVAYNKESDPLLEDEGWARYVKGRRQQPFHAVVLSVGKYNDPALPDIPTSRIDEKQLVTVLTDGRYSVDLLSDNAHDTFMHPTRSNFIRVLDTALANARRVESNTSNIVEEKEEALLERTPPVLVVVMARGVEGVLTFLDTGYNSRFAFTQEASYANDRKHSGIIPLASLMQLRDCFGRKPLVVGDLWTLRGGIQSIKGQPGIGFIGGFESVAGELDAQYPSNQEGGLLTYYFVKALQGKAGKGRGSTITTCAVNAYISDRLLKQKITVHTEANHLTPGNRIIFDKEAVSALRKQHKAFQGLARWHKCRWLTTAEIPLEKHNESTLKTHLLRELYKLVYRSSQAHCEDYVRQIQLVALSLTMDVSLYVSDSILNPAQGLHTWRDALKEWAGIKHDTDIKEVTVVRCAQVVRVKCTTLRAVQALQAAKGMNKPLLDTGVKNATLGVCLSFTGCLRDFHKMNKAARANILQTVNKARIKLISSKLVDPTDETKHLSTIIVQRLWKGFYIRKRQEILFSLFAMQSSALTSLKKEESDEWEQRLSYNRTEEQRVVSEHQATERVNLEEWEVEDRQFLWQRLLSSLSKTLTTPVDPKQCMAFFREVPDCFNKVQLMTRGCVETWESMNALLLEGIGGQIKIMHQYAASNIFKHELLDKNELWGRYNILHEEYTLRLTMHRTAQTGDVVIGGTLAGLKVPKTYRPVRPIANQSEVRWGQLVALEQQEINERTVLMDGEAMEREDINDATQWLQTELARIVKQTRSLSKAEAAKREKYLIELEREVIEDDMKKAADENFFATVAKTLNEGGGAGGEGKTQRDHKAEESRRKSDAVKRILLVSEQNPPQSSAGQIVRKMAHRQSLASDDLPVLPATPTFMPQAESTRNSHRNSFSGKSGPARHRGDSMSSQKRSSLAR